MCIHLDYLELNERCAPRTGTHDKLLFGETLMDARTDGKLNAIQLSISLLNILY